MILSPISKIHQCLEHQFFIFEEQNKRDEDDGTRCDRDHDHPLESTRMVGQRDHEVHAKDSGHHTKYGSYKCCRRQKQLEFNQLVPYIILKSQNLSHEFG